MATTTLVEQKQLIKYENDGGLEIIQMDDAPANTYTYEMMQQLDTAILRARMNESVHVIVLGVPVGAPQVTPLFNDVAVALLSVVGNVSTTVTLLADDNPRFVT